MRTAKPDARLRRTRRASRPPGVSGERHLERILDRRRRSFSDDAFRTRNRRSVDTARGGRPGVIPAHYRTVSAFTSPVVPRIGSRSEAGLSPGSRTASTRCSKTRRLGTFPADLGQSAAERSVLPVGRDRRSRPGIPSRRAQVTTDALRHDLSVVRASLRRSGRAPFQSGFWARTVSYMRFSAPRSTHETDRAQIDGTTDSEIDGSMAVEDVGGDPFVQRRAGGATSGESARRLIASKISRLAGCLHQFL